MIETRQTAFVTRRRSLDLGRRTYLLGILNLTPDSFSDGGEFFNPDEAVRHFHAMVRAGADIIDIGGESTRPGHVPVSSEEEMRRLVPFIETIRPHTEALISVDTSKALVADAVLTAGADIINDVWGAQNDPEMAKVIARHDAGCILMHNRDSAEAGTGDVMEAVTEFLKKSLAIVGEAGVRDNAIMLDPGVGFGKTFEENWEVVRRLSELSTLGYPLMLGASRKSMIAKLLKIEDPKARLSGTLATTALAIHAGVDFIRVHDVQANRECADVVDYCVRSGVR